MNETPYVKPLILYSTTACHLCELAEAILNSPGIIATLNLKEMSVTKVDISDSAELVEAYGTKIPVLRNPGNGAELDWPFDANLVEEFLS